MSRKIMGRMLLASTMLVAAFAVLGASSALAAPKGIFAKFAQCPTEIPGINICQYGVTTSGEFAIGKTRVPINKTLTLQGGAIKTGNPENGKEYFLLPAKNGESLSKTELNVPGGLLDIVNCEEIKGNGLIETIARNTCKAVFENKQTGVTATTELVANAHNPAILNIRALSSEEGTALTLPIRVHLKNPLLGNSCYIGSESNPIQLHLTTGTSGTLKGKRGEAETLEEKELTELRLFDNSLVDGTYSVPVSEGCGEFLFVKGFLDGIVNSKLALPSPSGNNKAILNGELFTASAENVIASEKF